MIKVGIIGATGYTGAELVRLIARHPKAEIVILTSQSYVGEKYTDIYPHLSKFVDLECSEQDIAKVIEKSDVIFTALPHGLSMDIVAAIKAKGKKVVDLGADFRLDDGSLYEEWYKVTHSQQDLLESAVYGLPELKKEEIAQSSIIGNPGCYPTSSVLALAPLLKEKLIALDSIIIDSKSGVSGAGRGLSLGAHYSECNENLKAYNIGVHRHIPEIEQELSKVAGSEVKISFTPHLIPMTRGILTTAYSNLLKDLSLEEVYALYQEFYLGKPFVRILSPGQLPQTKWVAGSNFCDIGLTVDKRTNRVVVVSAIDNLIKGAAGQAIQNMNLMFGLPEETGLDFPGMYL